MLNRVNRRVNAINPAALEIIQRTIIEPLAIFGAYFGGVISIGAQPTFCKAP